MALPKNITLDEFQSATYFLLETRGVGTYEQLSEIRGNSILSSIFVESIDPGATVKVNYYDTTTGASKGERYDLGGHDLVTVADSGDTIRILISKIHRRVVCEVIVTGGSSTFSVYATAVTSSASDIDSALARDGEDYTDPEDKAMPIAYLDDTTNQLFFVRGENGAIKVTGTVTALAGGKGTPGSRIVNIASANTEQPLVFPASAVSISVTNETTNAIFKASWQSGESGSQYFSIKPGQQYKEENLISPSLTLYVQSDKAGSDMHVVEWT